MSRATKAQTIKAIRTINKVLPEAQVTLIDWSSYGDGYAILTEDGMFDAIEISMNSRVIDAMPPGMFIEPINAGSLRLFRI